MLDRERQPGGIPRHCGHLGFGVRDLHRVMSGPTYARRYVQRARDAGVEILTEAMATGWSSNGSLEITSPSGRETLEASVVILATGCRERPRSARLVPGSRPQGVMTTGMLQQLVYLHGVRLGGRALVVGAEHVAFSAVATLAHAGARTVGMITEGRRHASFGAFRVGARLRYGVPLWTRTRVSAIRGRSSAREVELVDLDTEEVRRVPCDLVVFTGDWIPDHELAVTGGIELDPGTGGPAVDAGLRTSRPGIFAVGNLLHGAEPADIAALGGRRAGAAVAGYLADGQWPAMRIPVRCAPPLRWAAPNVFTPGSAFERLSIRSDALLRWRTVEVLQDGRSLWNGRIRRLGPGRSVRANIGRLHRLDPSGGPVDIRVVPTHGGPF